MLRTLLLILALSISSTATAREIVSVVFAFGPGDSVANYGRTLVEEANRLQTRYQFVFEPRPGAGGTIAAQHVVKTANAILASSAAFYVRPTVYPRDSHSVDQFSALMVQCTAPMAVASVRFQSWNQVDPQHEITFGITGLGASSHLVALQIQKRYPNLILVPFKSPSDAVLALVSGQIDMTVGFLSEFQQWANKGVSILGVTGSQSAQGVPTLASQGFAEVAHMANPQQLFVSSNIPVTQQQEWHRILSQAARADTVQRTYQADSCRPASLSWEDTQQFFRTQSDFWRRLATTIKAN